MPFLSQIKKNKLSETPNKRTHTHAKPLSHSSGNSDQAEVKSSHESNEAESTETANLKKSEAVMTWAQQ